jgi:hypothetical protein
MSKVTLEDVALALGGLQLENMVRGDAKKVVFCEEAAALVRSAARVVEAAKRVKATWYGYDKGSVSAKGELDAALAEHARIEAGDGS